MKRIVIFIIAIFFAFSNHLLAQTSSTPSNGFVFQAVAKDASDHPATFRNVHAIVNLISDNPNGTKVYSEKFKVMTNHEGIFTIIIGQGDRQFGVTSILDLDWVQKIYFLNLLLIYIE